MTEKPQSSSQEQPQAPQAPQVASAEKYFLVVVGDDSTNEPQLIECDDLEAFTRAVDETVLNAKNVIHAFGFVGSRIQISAPAPVCVVEVNGKRAEVGKDSRNFDASGRITPLRRGAGE